MQPNASAERLPSLTSMRFLAALAVLLFHATFIITFPPQWLPILNQGKAGVCFFFILSGFILTYTYFPAFSGGVSRDAWRQFLRNRFARVFPMHAFALLVITPGIAFLLWHNLLGILDWPKSLPLLGMSWLLNLLALQPWVPVKWVQELWNIPSWSVGCEAFFYLVFPFAISQGLGRIRRMRSLLLLLGGLWVVQTALFAVAVMVIRQLLPVHDDNRWYLIFFPERLPLLRVGEFLIGCTLGALFLRARATTVANAWWGWLDSATVRSAVLAAALGAIVGLTVATGDGLLGDVLSFGRWYPLYVPLFATVIFVTAWGRHLFSPLLENRALVLLGEASYSLYVIHWLPVIMITYFRVLYPVGMHWLISQETARNVVLAVLPLSLVCYRLIEVPARRRLRAKAARKL